MSKSDEEIRNDILTSALNKLQKAYKDKSEIYITTRDLLALQYFVSKTQFDYDFDFCGRI